MEKLTKAKGFKSSHAATLFLIGALTIILISSCNTKNDSLGRDLLPPDDNIVVYYDTLYDISTFPVYSSKIMTAETYGSVQSSRTFLLGSMKDSIFGSTKSEIVTQYDLYSAIDFGDTVVMDSIVLYLYISEVVGDSVEPFHIRVFETTDSISIDSAYYSNYDIAGKYNTDPLIDEFIIPRSDSLYEFRITSAEFKDKLLNIEDYTDLYTEDSIFTYNRYFKQVFTGLYITGEPVGNVNTFCKIHLANAYTRLGVHYTSENIDPDSTTGAAVYDWYYFTINESTSQKFNIFKHDYTGTAFNKVVGNEDNESNVLYVQGLGGINTKLRFNNIETWKDSGIVAINSAYLTFEVLPEELSGIAIDDLPDQLYLVSQLRDSTYYPVYDYLTNSTGFGGTLEQIFKGNVFVSDSCYVYRFNIGLQYQAMIDGTSDNADLILQVYNQSTTPDFCKLWSAYANREGRMKLEVVYTKL